jgi:hypothetical protein
VVNYSDKAIRALSKKLRVDQGLFIECVEASVVEIRETDGQLNLSNASALRLRRLERVCQTFDLEVDVAVMILDLVQRVTDLERRLNQKEKL